MIGIIVSERDIAGMSMLGAIKLRGFENSLDDFYGKPVFEKGNYRATTISEDIIYTKRIDELAEQLGLEFLVVASRHSSKSGRPTLTVHSAGNFGKAEYGGEDHMLQNTLANAKHNIYLKLRECTLDYEVSLEATHHGPTGFKTPLFFVEIGSSEKQWGDREAAKFVANAILAGLESRKEWQHAIGFGGGHYAPRFSGMEEVAFGHICAKYALDELTDELVGQMAEKTLDGIDFAVLDEKGMKGRHRVLVKGALDRLGIEY